MTGKLKIIRALANPKGKARAKRKRAIPNKKVRKRAVRSLSGKWIVRIITHTRTALYRAGGKWTKDRAAATRYATSAAAATALKNSGMKPAGWIVADVMPA